MNLDQQKKAFAEALLHLCPFVGLDARAACVKVPECLRHESLVLRLGRNPAVIGMPDLELDERGFRATISLRGELHYVDVPWHVCSAMWIDAPFVGPTVQWPVEVERAAAPEPAPEAAPALKLVK